MSRKRRRSQFGLITTWARIAKYCDREPRTVMRYHYELGMPVYRLSGNVACIIPDQINVWLRAYDLVKKMRKKKRIKCVGFSCLRLIGNYAEILLLYEQLLGEQISEDLYPTSDDIEY